jgi:hypothetical protein
MSETDSPRTRPLQFSLLTVMVVTATVAIVLALSMWNPPFGGPASILIAGSTWTALAVRAGRRRLAYYLAGATIGPVALGVVFLGMHFVEPRSFDFPTPWVSMGLLPVFSPATTASVWVLRDLIRRRRWGGGIGASLAFLYLTAALIPIFLVLFSPGVALVVPLPDVDPGDLMTTGIWLTLMSPFVVTLYLALAWPVAIVCVNVLRWIDPPPGLSPLERRVIKAVKTLQAGGVTPIDERHVAGAAAGDVEAVGVTLDRLFVEGVLTWTPEDGYRVADR